MRLPFLSASVGPYLAGAFVPDAPFRPIRFSLGLAAVIGCHLSANLINDVADAESGADSADLDHHGFFGGSKLIQAGMVSKSWYRAGGIVLGLLATACVCVLAWLMQQALPLWFFAVVLGMAWSYSQRPMRLSYRYLGELTVLGLFGPATVVGAAAIQRGAMVFGPEVLVSLPVGLMTAGILLANEVPEAPTDAAAGKRNLVTLVGPERGWAVYLLCCAVAWGMLGALLRGGLIGPMGWTAMLSVPAGLGSAAVLRRHPRDKYKLHASSKLAILAQALAVGGILAGGLW